MYVTGLECYFKLELIINRLSVSELNKIVILFFFRNFYSANKYLQINKKHSITKLNKIV